MINLSINKMVFFMVQGDWQQESLKTLKLINAASTALRLYPGDSAQVTNSFENAYRGTKQFIRNNELLRFSLLSGSYMLNGEPVDNPTREWLQLLTFSDQLRKLELNELIFSQGFDRLRFKKILSVFSATPEQVQTAGGGRAFIEQLGLTDIFPEHYYAPGESKEEKKQKEKFDQTLRELSAGDVDAEYIHFLVGRRHEEKIKRALHQSFQSPEKGGHIVAATTYSLVQILSKNHVVAVAPAFSKVLENVTIILDQSQYQKVSDKSAIQLVPHLDETSVLMLICQDFSSPFGEYFYDALLTAIGVDTLTRILSWIRSQQVKGAAGKEELEKQLHVVTQGADKLLSTSCGKKILAQRTTKEKLQKTELIRKEKRLQATIKAFVKGDLSKIENEDVCLSLPSTIEKLLNNGKESVAAVIVQNVVKGLTEQGHGYRDRLAQVFGGVVHKLVQMERWEWLEKLTPVSLSWIRENEIADFGFQQLVQAMQAVMNRAWLVDNVDLAEQILNVFYHIRSGAMGKTDAVCKVVGQIQDDNVDFALLQNYLDRCFAKPVDEMLCRKIVMQGPVAARFLLDTLIASGKRSHRIRLLKILSELGENLIPVLLERLPDPMPWFGKRNIIRLLAETGTEENVQAVLGYICHEDLRVQQEALQCIMRLGKKSTEKYLLQVLPIGGVPIKVLVLKHLQRIATGAVVVPLHTLLEECQSYSGSAKKRVSLEIIRALGASGSKKAFPVLQGVIGGGNKNFGRKSIDAAEIALSFIREQTNRERKSKQKPRMKRGLPVIVSPETNPESLFILPEYELITRYPEEKEVYKLLQQDKKKTATQMLLQLIDKTAYLKQFNDAELLRMRLIEVDPMALSDIVKAADFIEEAKSDSIDQDHIFIWSDLYDLLSTEEFNVFYHTLKHETYTSEETIVQQGDPQWRLFFVNKGRVKLCYSEQENQTLVKTLRRGNVFGGTSFFDESVWTLSAITMGAVELSTLSMDSVEEWGEVYPELEGKLQVYCQRFDRVNEFFISSGADRRAMERFSLIGTVVRLMLLDDKGRCTETSICGECSDISSGGFSFVSNISNRTQARTLLGRQVEFSLENDAASGKSIQLTGTVVAIRKLHSVELGRSVHIQFDSLLEQDKMMDIVNAK